MTKRILKARSKNNQPIPIYLKESHMDQIVDDFIKSKNTAHGYGLFKDERSINNGQKDVVDFAMNVGKGKKRQWDRHGIVPPAFISYLQYLKVIPQDLVIPKDKRTTKEFANLLSQISENQIIPNGFRDLIQEARERRLKNLNPEMKPMFVSGEKLGNDLHKQKNKLSLDRRQGHKKKEVIKIK